MVEQSMIALLVVVTPIIRVGNCAVSSTDLCVGFTDALNSMRQAVAKGLPGYGNIPRSQSMFALSCYYELVQAAIVNTEVCKPVNFLNGGKSMNYWAMITTRNPLTDAEIIQRAVDSWRIPVINYGLRADAVYRDKRLEAFANAVYYKSIYFGCAIKTCKATKIMPAFQAAACVFNSAPVLNRPLYTPSTAYTGCTSDQQCRNLLPGATCGTEVVPPKGLCLSNGRNFLTDAPSRIPTTLPATVPSSIASTASSVAASTSQSSASSTTTTTTTTPAPTTTGPIAQETRDRVVAVHNNRRYLLANGRVVNGLTKTNCGTARNIFAMWYDLGLEIDAQNYANQCPTNENGSPVSSRPTQGENVKIIYSNSIPFYYAVDSAVQSWWDQIAINGINAKMLFTDFLQTKPLAPIKFTQMAWAASYRVGCGAQRCGGTTVVVCRYSPRGNIVGEHIYNVGTVCGDCINSCTSEGLCTPPTRS